MRRFLDACSGASHGCDKRSVRAADGVSVRAECAPPLMGRWNGKKGQIRLDKATGPGLSQSRAVLGFYLCARLLPIGKPKADSGNLLSGAKTVVEELS